MKKVIGLFPTKWGACRFDMDNGHKVTIRLGRHLLEGLTVNSIKYVGYMIAQRKELEGPWEEIVGKTNIFQVDEKPITNHTLKADLVQAWENFASRQGNNGVFVMAAYCNVENNREKLVNELRLVQAALTQFDRNQSELRNALTMAVNQLPPSDHYKLEE